MKFTFSFIALALLFACGKSPEPGPEPVPPPPPIPVPEDAARVQIGTPAIEGQTYRWSPTDTVDDVTKPMPIAFPKKTTTYTVTVTSKCGQAKSSVMVHVFKQDASGELVEVK